MNDVEQYLLGIEEPQKSALLAVRNTIKLLVPDAQELISYGIPAFKHKKRILIYYAAHANHMSIYPASDEMIEIVGQKLAPFRTSKGTLQFTVEKPIPDVLLKKIIAYRLSIINS